MHLLLFELSTIWFYLQKHCKGDSTNHIKDIKVISADEIVIQKNQ